MSFLDGLIGHLRLLYNGEEAVHRRTLNFMGPGVTVTDNVLLERTDITLGGAGVGAGTGDVVGPSSATDNSIARYDGGSGKLIQRSAVIIDDSGNILTPGTVDGRDVGTDGAALDAAVTIVNILNGTTSNGAVRRQTQVIAGAGLTGGGTLATDVTLNVIANVDGSIVVTSDAVGVGVLATDTQHGVRGGGSQHALVTTTVAGFMSPADKVKLDGITGTGGGGGVSLANTPPASVGVANAIGVLGTAAHADHVHAHGNQPGGTFHDLVTQSVAGFMSFADKIKLDNLGSGTSGFLNVLDEGVIAGTRPNTAARIANTTAFNLAVIKAKDTGKILLVPPVRYEIYGSINIYKDFFCWKGSFGSIIVQYKLDTAVIHVGPPLGTPYGSGIIGSVYIDGAQLRYAGVATAGGHAFEETSAWRCNYQNIAIGDPDGVPSNPDSVPWHCFHSDQITGTLPCFSNVYRNFICKMYGHRAWSMDRDDNGNSAFSTGSTLENVYLSNGGGPGALQRSLQSVPGAAMMVITAYAEINCTQINFEWSGVPNVLVINNSQGVNFRGLHVEGVEIKQGAQDRAAFLHAIGSHVSIDGCTLQSCTANAANNVDGGALFMVGYGGSINYRNVTMKWNTHTGTDFSVVRSSGYGGQDGIRVDAGHVEFGSADQITRYEDCTLATQNGRSIFGTLTDFESKGVFFLPDVDNTLYRYLSCGTYVISPSSHRNLILSRYMRSGLAELNPKEISIKITHTGSGGTVHVVNDGPAGGYTYIPAYFASTYTFSFDASGNWRLTEQGALNNPLELSNVAPQAVSNTFSNSGVAEKASRDDHTHTHGVQLGGNTHAIVTTTVAGFMSPADKGKLDSIGSQLTLATTNPISVSNFNFVGSLNTAAKADHVHDHGALAGGDRHALVTQTVAGFMSAADKVKLDNTASGATSITLANNIPNAVGPSGSAGSFNTASKGDHTHAHGSHVDGTNHAAATTGTAGFMSATDKANLNALIAVPALTIGGSAVLTSDRFLALGQGLDYADGGPGQAFTIFSRSVVVNNRQLPLDGWPGSPPAVSGGVLINGIARTFNEVKSIGISSDQSWYMDLTKHIYTKDPVTLTALALYIQPQGGHSALPGVMPRLILQSTSSLGVPTNHFTQIDPSANLAQYQGSHAIAWTGSIVLDPAQRWTLAFLGESPANSNFVFGTALLSLFAGFATT